MSSIWSGQSEGLQSQRLLKQIHVIDSTGDVTKGVEQTIAMDMETELLTTTPKNRLQYCAVNNFD
jgi:predicted short-subunit dehydrogenase-like oxidoreductase (DUF2520 family)